jgi:hypothetical protein
VTSPRLTIAAFAGALALALPALALPLPKGLDTYLLGPKMIHSEVALQTADGLLHDFQLDRGRLLKRLAAGSLVVSERDGTNASLKVSPSARVLLNGRSSSLRALRPGMQVVVSHDHDLPADAVYASSTKAAPNLPHAISSFLLGGRMVRAEIALRSVDGVLHDYLLDHGRIKQLGPASLMLREVDGTIVTINVSATAHVTLNGQSASFAQLRKGMMATTMRDGDTPADSVYATGR